MNYNKYTKKELIQMLQVRERPVCSGLQSVVKQLEEFQHKQQEHFVVLTLDGAHKLIDKHVVSIGLVNKTIVHPREVFAPAIEDRAVAVVVAHNHPSGNLDPSGEDREVASKLCEAGKLLGIPLFDSLVVGGGDYYSMAENHEYPFM